MTAHAEFLRVAASDDQLAERVKKDFRRAGLAPRITRLLEFVETVTLAPWEIGHGQWDQLRAAGWKDLEIAHAALGSAHFNYLNRVADGLGIQFEYHSELTPFAVQDAGRESIPELPRRSAPHSIAGRRPFVRIDPADAAAARAGVRVIEGEPSAFAAVLAVNPEASRVAREWRAYHFTGTERLPAKLRASLALYGAAVENAAPCIAWQSEAAQRLGVPQADVDDLARAQLPPLADERTGLLFEHVRRLLQSPWTTTQEHVDQLKATGLDDRDIVKLTTFVAYLSFEHRTALALGA